MSADETPPLGEITALPAIPAEPAFPPEPLTPLPSRTIPEDINVPWGALDIVVFIVAAVIWIFVLGVLLFLVVGAFGISPAMIQNSVREQSIISIMAMAVGEVSALGFLALYIRRAYVLPFWRAIGWRRLRIGQMPTGIACAGLIMIGALLSFLVEAASSLHVPTRPLPVEVVFQDKLSSLLFMLMAVLLAPVVEETIFRGYIYPVVARSWGIAAGIVVTGALFGLLHGFQLGGALWQTSLLLVVGGIFTWVRAGTKTVLASYLLHFGYNSFLFVGFLVSTHFLQTMPTH